MKRLLIITLSLFVAVAVNAAKPQKAKPRTVKSVKTEQQATRREISETKAKINRNTIATRRKLDQLNDLSARIDRQIVGIDSLHRRLADLDSGIINTQTRINTLSDTVASLRNDLKSTLRAMRTRRKLHNNVAFVFAAQSFNQAFKRGRYLADLNAWRTRKISRLRDAAQQLEQQKASLEAMRADKSSSLAQLTAGKSILENKRVAEQQMISELRRENSNLNTILKQKQQRARQLDAELNRIIEQQRIAEEKRRAEAKRKAEEERRKQQAANTSKPKTEKPAATGTEQSPAQKDISGVADADRQLSGSFAANRGRLLFPVAGHYTIVSVFGRSHHRTLSNIEVNNSGIDIAVAPGTTARAVFEGTVSSLFYMNGFQNIVIVRHGEYLTVYAGITNLKVKKGQNVKAGTPIGTVYTDTENGEKRTVLHFEVRKEREKLNPLEWVR